MSTDTTTEANAKKDIQKLQRAIVDGLEDVKAQDIQVFSTEHLSPLFERVVIASGTSNRQTKALAASVRDAVREAGFPKPRTEGEDNGEWIIVDCGQAVVHVMQPAIRQYYHLEDLWGEKPVRLKFGADKPKVVLKTSAKAEGTAESAKKKSGAVSTSLKRSSAAKKGQAAEVEASKSGKKPAGKKAAAKSAAGKGGSQKSAYGKKAPAKKAAPLKVVKVNDPKKAVPAKTAAKKTTARPAVAKPAAKKTAAKKATR